MSVLSPAGELHTGQHEAGHHPTTTDCSPQPHGNNDWNWNKHAQPHCRANKETDQCGGTGEAAPHKRENMFKKLTLCRRKLKLSKHNTIMKIRCMACEHTEKLTAFHCTALNNIVCKKITRGKNRQDCVSLLLWLHVNDLMWDNCTAFPVISTALFPQKGSISLSQSHIRLFKRHQRLHWRLLARIHVNNLLFAEFSSSNMGN